MKRLLPALVLLAACGNDETRTPDVDAGVDPDPLAVESTAQPGSLDELHERVIARRCSGQPGLCHNGQFEPNLSTPALTYAYVVNRPGIEKSDRLRAKPGDPANSLLIDKIRNRNNVATLMPLGAEPLEEADIQAIEAWITAGALRAPGAAPAPVLNNPPKRPQLAIFNGTTRLDGVGPVNVTAGMTITLRHTVQDFDTADVDIPFAGVTLNTNDGRAVVLDPANTNDPQTGQTAYDPSPTAPMGNGDKLNYQRSWTIPATLPLVTTDDLHTPSTMPAAGARLTLQAFYIDSLDTTDPLNIKFGMFAFEASMSTINIQ